MIYLVRHGEIDKPRPHSFIGQTDLPLNGYGIHQAQHLRQQLQDIPFNHVFSSPLQRAVQTASIAGGRPLESIEKIENLKEINLGEWEGLQKEEVTTRFPGEYQQRGEDLEFFRPKGGESFADLAKRCYPTLLNLVSSASPPILIVAHAGVIRVILARILGKSLQEIFDIPQDYCGVNILQYSSGKLTAVDING